MGIGVMSEWCMVTQLDSVTECRCYVGGDE